MKPTESTARYRPDVDGLRAVAVVLVILYHLHPRLAPQGFVGVDIFFVISGFVVTGSVVASQTKNPFQGMVQFWRRRILRIMPAILLMVVVCMIGIATFRPPFPTVGYNSEIKTGISSVFGLANFYLYRSSQDYFRTDLSANPFVHTWSLGVEEQFYFAFAVAFIGLIGIIRDRNIKFTVSLAAMALLGSASYCAFLLNAQSHPSMTYYFITFRFWEIAAGSLLAYLALKFPDFLRPKSLALATSLQVLALLFLASVIWWVRPSGFPTTAITVAASCAAVLIATGRGKVTPIERILSARVVVGIGLISYSLYLWHYPILLFWRTNFGLHTTAQIVSAILLTFLAALFSYWAIERRIRHTKIPFATVVLPSVLGIVIVLTAFGWLLEHHPGRLYIGSTQQWAADWNPGGTYSYAGQGRIVSSDCELMNGDAVPSEIPGQCYSSPQGKAVDKPTLLLVGDSHAYADWGMAASGASMNAFRFATLVHDGCGPGAGRSDRSQSCNSYWDDLPAIIRRTLRQGDIVLIAALWEPDPAWTARANETITAIVRAADEQGVQVIIEAPLPTFERPAYLCTKEWFRSNYDGCSADRRVVELGRDAAMTKLQTMTREYGNARVWDPLRLLCPADVCEQFRDGKPIFRDMNHLSYYGSKSLAPAFVDFLAGSRNAAPASAPKDLTASRARSD